MDFTLLAPHLAPFTLALALLFALVALELAFMLIGFSLIGDAGDVDVDIVDVPDIGDLPDLGVDTDIPDIGDYDIPDIADAPELDAGLDADPGVLAWLGMGKAPFVIWLGAILMGFGSAGLGIQFILTSIGITLPVTIVALPAIVCAIWFAKTFASWFVAILPKSETTAISTKRFGGYRGVVTQGTARRGHPAEVRIVDRFHNTHYMRAEPLRDDDRIRQGSDVIILRNIRTGDMRLLAVS